MRLSRMRQRLAGLFSPPARGSRHAPRRRPPPQVEMLEQRAVPSAFPIVRMNNPSQDDTTVHDTQSTVSLAVVPNAVYGNDTVVSSYQDSGVQAQGSPPRVDASSVSTNGGATFSYNGRYFVYVNDPSSKWDGGNPLLLRNSTSGTIYALFQSQPFTTASGTTVRRSVFTTSTNNGASFAVSTNPAGPPIFNYNTVSNLSAAIDNFSGAGQGYIFTAFNETQVATPPSNLNGAPPGLHFAYSADGGTSWNFPTSTTSPSPSTTDPDKPLFDTTASGASVVVAPNGNVYVFFLVSTPVGGSVYTNQIYMVESTTLGATWGAPIPVGSPLNNTALNGALPDLSAANVYSDSFPRAAVNPVNGDVYLTYNDTTAAGDPGNIVFERLSSAGAVLQSMTLNDDAPTDTTDLQWEPSIAVTPDGIHVFVDWYDTRGGSMMNGLPTSANVYGLIGSLNPGSANAPVTFMANLPITGSPYAILPGQDSAGGGTMINVMGNYNAAAAAPGVFYAAFTSTALGGPNNAENANVSLATIGLVAGTVATSGTVTESVPYSGPVATFTTPYNGAEGPFTAMINWGDGSAPTMGTITGGPTFTVSGTHTYYAPATRKITVTITDSFGSASALQGSVVVQPNYTGWTSLGKSYIETAVGVTAGGTVEAFAIGTDHTLSEREMIGGSWGPWVNLGGGCAPVIALARNAAGYLDAFVIGQDNQIWYQSQTGPGTFTGWFGLGGNASALVAGNNANGTEQVFWVSRSDNTLETRYQTSVGGPYAAAEDLGGGCTPHLALARNSSGFLDAFVIGMDNQIWYQRQTAPGTFAGWAGLGGNASALVAGNNANGTEEVFWVNRTDNTLVTRYQTSVGGPYAAAENLGGGCQGPLGVVLDPDGNLDPVVLAQDTQVWYLVQTSPGVFAGWYGLNAQLTQLETTTTGAGLGEIIGLGPDGTVWARSQTSPGVWG